MTVVHLTAVYASQFCTCKLCMYAASTTTHAALSQTGSADHPQSGAQAPLHRGRPFPQTLPASYPATSGSAPRWCQPPQSASCGLPCTAWCCHCVVKAAQRGRIECTGVEEAEGPDEVVSAQIRGTVVRTPGVGGHYRTLPACTRPCVLCVYMYVPQACVCT